MQGSPSIGRHASSIVTVTEKQQAPQRARLGCVGLKSEIRQLCVLQSDAVVKRNYIAASTAVCVTKRRSGVS